MKHNEDNYTRCLDIQEQICSIDWLEDEITSKVEREFTFLKSSIDVQKRDIIIINNLESVKNYKLP